MAWWMICKSFMQSSLFLRIRYQRRNILGVTLWTRRYRRWSTCQNVRVLWLLVLSPSATGVVKLYFKLIYHCFGIRYIFKAVFEINSCPFMPVNSKLVFKFCSEVFYTVSFKTKPLIMLYVQTNGVFQLKKEYFIT